jgi:hypothetical protein
LAKFAERCLGQRNAAAHKAFFGQTRQTLRVCARAARFRQHRVVTCHFTLNSDPFVQPPNRRVKEKDSFHHLLGEIRPVVPTAEMRKFVKQNLIQLGCRKLTQDPTRDQNGGLEKTDGGWNSHSFRSAEGNLSTQSVPLEGVRENRI